MGKNSNRNNSIYIKGARTHNLKNIDLEVPKNKLIVVTGVSGSGKSSLTIDTLFAEGQRRYVESLSSYARQFLIRMNKPDVDYIKGICPAIALEQKSNTRNARSTVGTMSEIYDYLKLLYARIGKTISPVSGEEVKKHAVSDVVDFINSYPDGTKVLLYTPLIHHQKRKIRDELKILLQRGISRLYYNKQLIKTEEVIEQKVITDPENIHILIDRFVVKKEDEENNTRIADSAEIAFYEGHGTCTVEVIDGPVKNFSNKFELDDIAFEEPDVNLFSFTSPHGICKNCEGFGTILGIDEDLVVPDKSKSVYDDAVVCWKGDSTRKWKEQVVKNGINCDFPIHRSYSDLTEEEKGSLWNGCKCFKGIYAFFQHLESKSYKIQYRVLLSRYRGKTICPTCKGSRLRPEANYIKAGGRSISELVLMSVSDLNDFFRKLTLDDYEKEVTTRILTEISQRLDFLLKVGLGYLSLHRDARTLSGGESQRINLAKFLGSTLINSLYILDEPSIGLHPRDTKRLVEVLFSLRDLKNTVVIVEHDEDIMRSADHIIDMGPNAGELGGEIVAEGDFESVIKTDTLTARYLKGDYKITSSKTKRKWNNYIHLQGARQNNLKDISVKLPLNVMTVVTGVSGSGKTTLVKEILCPALQKIYRGTGDKPGTYDSMEGDIRAIEKVELVDQNPIGRSSRSNPVTYMKAFDAIRKLYASQKLSAIKGFKPAHFSFNVEGGRCENCKGEGVIIVEMQFMPDIHLTCEECKGKRFQQSVLDIVYNGKNIADVLEMTVNEAIEFFNKEKEIIKKLQPLQDVGLGYVRLGQSSTTLSGGEAQRVKLASFLQDQGSETPTLFIFDEPTTGLHFHDIKKLLNSFDALLEKDHSILIIEHNLDVINYADWIIDLGPEGGKEGGYIVFEGTPDDLVHCEESYTGQFLKEKRAIMNS